MVSKMSAHLSLVLLLQCVKLTLVAVEVVVVRLLSKVPHHLPWRVVEVPLGVLSSTTELPLAIL